MRRAFAYAFIAVLATSALAHGRANLVPPGWLPDHVDPGDTGRRYVSPDGTSWMAAKQTVANRDRLSNDMDAVTYRPEEQITYHKRGATWVAVSGYRGDQIFYRKSNLACGGTRWNTVEFQYPIAAKQQMDETVTRIAHGMTEYY